MKKTISSQFPLTRCCFQSSVASSALLTSIVSCSCRVFVCFLLFCWLSFFFFFFLLNRLITWVLRHFLIQVVILMITMHSNTRFTVTGITAHDYRIIGELPLFRSTLGGRNSLQGILQHSLQLRNRLSRFFKCCNTFVDHPKFRSERCITLSAIAKGNTHLDKSKLPLLIKESIHNHMRGYITYSFLAY